MLFITSGEASQEAEPEDAILKGRSPQRWRRCFPILMVLRRVGAQHRPRCGLSCNQESRRFVPAEPGDAIFSFRIAMRTVNYCFNHSNCSSEAWQLWSSTTEMLPNFPFETIIRNA